MSDEEVYCICRSSDVSRFMIACDHCEEWYHGDCIKVTERDAKYIKRYYCRMCIHKNPKLAVVYKTKHLDRSIKERRETDRDRHRREKHKKHKRDHERRRDRDKDRKRETRDYGDDKERKRGESAAGEADDSVESSGQVDGEHKRQVVMEERSPNIVPVGASLLRKKDVADDCVTSSPKCSTKSEEKGKSKKRKISRDKNASGNSSDGSFGARGEVRSDRASSSSSSEEAWKPKASKSKVKHEPPRKRPIPRSETSRRSKRRRRNAGGGDSSSEDEAVEAIDATPRQCFGVKCVNAARPGSNYCSDNCGINMASVRIMQTLPDRIREWNLTPCEAETRNRKELEKIRARQDAVKAKLEQLNHEFKELEDIIAAGKSQTIDKEKEDEDEETETAEITMHCVTCGADVQTRTAIRHMERCYNKMESQTSFASKFKTQIEDERMFCDYFNAKDETYCKRLQVLCPEHNPDAKFPAEDEVCGYPIQKEVFGKPTEFCRLSKKKCQTHAFWEKLRRAEIDMERVRQWMKVDELLEQERVVKLAMSNRAGLLGLLLNSTFNHELDDRFQAQRAAAAAAQKAAQMRKMQQQRQAVHLQTSNPTMK